MKKGLKAAALALAFSMLSSATAFAGVWEGQEGAWRYRNDDGSYAVAQWVNDKENWYYLEADGLMKTGWYQDAAGAWYYLEPDSGVMAAGVTKNIDGVDYTFDSSGVWLQPQAASGWDGLTFRDQAMDLQFTVPDGYSIIDPSSMLDSYPYLRACAQSSDGSVRFFATLYDMPNIAQYNISAHDLAVAFAKEFPNRAIVRTVDLNGCTYEQVAIRTDLLFISNSYFRRVGDAIVCIDTDCLLGDKAQLDQIVNSIKSFN